MAQLSLRAQRSNRTSAEPKRRGRTGAIASLRSQGQTGSTNANKFLNTQPQADARTHVLAALQRGEKVDAANFENVLDARAQL